MHDDPSTAAASRLQRHWRRHRRVVGGLTALWALAAFGAPWFAARDPRDAIQRNADLWIAAGLLPLFFFAVVLAFAVLADRLDDAYRADTDG